MDFLRTSPTDELNVDTMHEDVELKPYFAEYDTFDLPTGLPSPAELVWSPDPTARCPAFGRVGKGPKMVDAIIVVPLTG